jgi:hypothetical protein
MTVVRSVADVLDEHVTLEVLRIALFLTRVHSRLVRPGLAQVLSDVDTGTALRRQFDRLDATLQAEAQRLRLIA